MIYVINKISRTARYGDDKTLKVELKELWGSDTKIEIITLPFSFVADFVLECSDDLSSNNTFVVDDTDLETKIRKAMLDYVDREISPAFDNA